MGNARVEVNAVGDILLARDVWKTIERIGTANAGRRILSVTGRSDLNFGNLECPLSNRGCAKETAETSFRGPPEAAKMLADANFKVVSLANNHMHDYGAEAIEDTIAVLADQGIAGIGIGRTPSEARKGVIITTPSGIRVGFLAYTSDTRATNRRNRWVAAHLNVRDATEDLARMRRDADIVLVSWHAGYEMVDVPSPQLRNMAVKIAEAGAHAILGHGPHVLQAVQTIRGVPVFYSLGNFVFDQPWACEREQSIIVAGLVFEREGLMEMSLTPVWIGPDWFPDEATAQQRQEIGDRITRLNRDLSTSDIDKQYWNKVGSRVFRDQFGMIGRVYQKAGMKGLLAALSKVRGRHFVLLVAAIRSRLQRLFAATRLRKVDKENRTARGTARYGNRHK
jgi:poly-gamma-glutamate synthesis protein (capsule biosynthesis protein)